MLAEGREELIRPVMGLDVGGDVIAEQGVGLGRVTLQLHGQGAGLEWVYVRSSSFWEVERASRLFRCYSSI